MSEKKADLQKEVERLREEVRELKSLQLRIWEAFSEADSTLRIRYSEDLRGAYSKDEAERLTRYMTGATQ